MKQCTIGKEVSIQGIGLHTGENVRLTFKPAKANSGIIFRRVDLPNAPEILPIIQKVGDLVRCTTIQSGDVKIHTVEHVLSTLAGMGIDNIIVELNAEETPLLDGSAKYFAHLLREAGVVELDAERKVFKLTKSISIAQGNRSLQALPYDGLKITCTSADDYGHHFQTLTLDINPDTYINEIAPARTFAVYEDIEPLLKAGKIKGASLDAAVLIKGDQILSKEPLRFTDEFVRHKILDILGDLSLLGMSLQCHITAVRPGHALNAELTRKIFEQYAKEH